VEGTMSHSYHTEESDDEIKAGHIRSYLFNNDKKYDRLKSYCMGFLLFFILPLFFISCRQKELPNQDMIDLLKAAEKNDYNYDNVFSPGAIAAFYDSVIHNSSDENVGTGST
jgi:hypothetical protein